MITLYIKNKYNTPFIHVILIFSLFINSTLYAQNENTEECIKRIPSNKSNDLYAYDSKGSCYFKRFSYFRNMQITESNKPYGMNRIDDRKINSIDRGYFLFINRTSGLVDRVKYMGPRNSKIEINDIHEWIFFYTDDYKQRSLCTRISTRNKKGKPQKNKEGIAHYTFSYNSDNMIKEISFLNNRNKPQKNRQGFYHVKLNYNKHREISQRCFYGPEKKPMKATQHSVHCIQYTYKENNKLIDIERYLDKYKKPTTNREGIFATQFGYSTDGQQKPIAAYNINGKRIQNFP